METQNRSLVHNQIKLEQAKKQEAKIREAATLAKAEKEGLIASSFSQIPAPKDGGTKPAADMDSLSRQEAEDVE